MEKSITFEKTIQVEQYEPIKVSSTISNIPQEIWTSQERVDELYNSLIVEAYKVIGAERQLLQKLSEAKENGDSRLDVLNNMQLKSLESISINKEK